MTTETIIRFEFRCTNCWQPLRAGVDAVGTQMECRWCHHQVEIPEATERRIEQAAVAPEPAQPAEPIYDSTPLSREQINTLAAERAQERVAARSHVLGPEAMPQASRGARLLAAIVDSLLIGCAAFAGVLLVMGLANAGFVRIDSAEPQSMADVPWQAIGVVLFFPFAICFINWNLIATQGQTIGKKLFGIRIVDDTGDVPGFFRGVVIRNWMRSFLGSIIPFFGLIDVLFIFGDPPRCVHDRMAGTFVVHARVS